MIEELLIEADYKAQTFFIPWTGHWLIDIVKSYAYATVNLKATTDGIIYP